MDPESFYPRKPEIFAILCPADPDSSPTVGHSEPCDPPAVGHPEGVQLGGLAPAGSGDRPLPAGPIGEGT